MYDTVAIANGTTTSTDVTLGQDNGLAAIVFPGTFTGATVTIQAALDGTNFVTVQQVGGGGDYTVTAAAGKAVPVDPRVGKFLRHIRIVSASNETGDRTVGIAKDVFA